MADISFISAFLNRDGVEGPRQTTGYVPCQPKNYRGGPNPQNYRAIGVSGVTIATGCDLGQTDAATMRGYGLEESRISILAPYFGLKKADAIRKLRQAPLVVSASCAEALDHAVHRGYLDRFVRPAWEKASGKSFDALPREAQAVIFSVCFQKGCGGTRRDYPLLWSYLVRCEWSDASRELIHGFRQYAGRRKIEGMLLKSLF